jgi:hypothetical protein
MTESEAIKAVGTTLHLPGGVSATFDAPVAEWLSFPEAVVVRLRPADKAPDPQNVFGVAMDGRILWRVPKKLFNRRNSPYVGLSRRGDVVALHNWESVILDVDPRTGAILRESWGK